MAVRKNVAVIGAGLGGLSAAINLAKKGYFVEVFEKNNKSGGKANIISEKGFTFDTGPTLLTMPFVLDDLFNDTTEYLNIIPLENICKYFYSDGSIINAYSDPQEFANEISKNSDDSKQSVINYLKYCKTIYDLTADLFLLKVRLN